MQRAAYMLLVYTFAVEAAKTGQPSRKKLATKLMACPVAVKLLLQFCKGPATEFLTMYVSSLTPPYTP